MKLYRYPKDIARLIGYLFSLIIWNYFVVSLLVEQWNPLYWTKTPLCFFTVMSTFGIFYKVYQDIKDELSSTCEYEIRNIDNLRDKLHDTQEYLGSIERETKKIMKNLKIKE